MEETKKLYKVTLKGMGYSSTGVAYGISYVIATNTDLAYKKVRAFLDKEDKGFKKDRELDKIELLAEDLQYTDAGSILYL